MVKHTQTIRWLLSPNCLSMFDHSVGLALKGITFTKRTLVNLNNCYCMKKKCNALRDLVPFFQFKKREKHPTKSATFSKVATCSLQRY